MRSIKCPIPIFHAMRSTLSAIQSLKYQEDKGLR